MRRDQQGPYRSGPNRYGSSGRTNQYNQGRYGRNDRFSQGRYERNNRYSQGRYNRGRVEVPQRDDNGYAEDGAYGDDGYNDRGRYGGDFNGNGRSAGRYNYRNAGGRFDGGYRGGSSNRYRNAGGAQRDFARPYGNDLQDASGDYSRAQEMEEYQQEYHRDDLGVDERIDRIVSDKLAQDRPSSRPVPEDDSSQSTFEAEGILEPHGNGFGFLRDPKSNYDRKPGDPFISGALLDKFNIRPGCCIRGKVQANNQPAAGGRGAAGAARGPRMVEILNIDGKSPEEYFNVQNFEDLTPINPEVWLRLETEGGPISTRVIDILAPLGKGQRALIVAPPRSGKTVLLQQMAQAISTNYKSIHVIVFLVDERPEEVTDFRRSVDKSVEVVASSLDCPIENHIRLSRLVIERCKRLTEEGKDVFLLLDSITRLARAYNKWCSNSGRTMTGGLDVRAMDIPKKIFSSARAVDGGGSLTIVGTALVDTGSRMDELIFQEFKGTGNMELVLDRRLAERRIWPAIDISKSGTRREEKILPPGILHLVNKLRRTITGIDPVEGMERLTTLLERTPSNLEFFKMFDFHGLLN